MDVKTEQAVEELVAGEHPAMSGTLRALVAAVQRLAEENAGLAAENTRLTEEVERLGAGRLTDSKPVYDADEPAADEQPVEETAGDGDIPDAAVTEGIDNIPDAAYARLIHEAVLPAGPQDAAADYWPPQGVTW